MRDAHSPRDWMPVVIAAIATIPPTIASVGALVVAWNSSAKVEAVQVQVQEVHKATNSMKDALVAAALIQGRVEGAKAEKDRQGVSDADVAKGRAEQPKGKP